MVTVQASTWHSRKSAYPSRNSAVALSLRSRAKEAAQMSAAMFDASVEGEYPLASSQRSCWVAGPWWMR